MSSKSKLTLKEAREKNKIDEFIKEREKELPHADKECFDATLKSMLQGKHSEGQKSSD